MLIYIETRMDMMDDDITQPKDEEEGKTFYFHLSSFSCFTHSHFYVFDP